MARPGSGGGIDGKASRTNRYGRCRQPFLCVVRGPETIETFLTHAASERNASSGYIIFVLEYLFILHDLDGYDTILLCILRFTVHGMNQNWAFEFRAGRRAFAFRYDILVNC